MKIIRDPTLTRHHTEVVKAVTFIFKALGIKSVPYIAQVIPSMLNVIRASEDNFRDFLFQQLGGLIAIVRQHVRNYLDSIFDLIMEFWSVDSPLQPTIILLVENISIALGKYFLNLKPKYESLVEGCQGCQLTPLEFWRLAQLNPIFSPFIGQKSD